METVLQDPGLVENDSDGMSCFLACTQMVMRSRNGAAVPSFDELGKIIRRKTGEYSWEYAMLSYLSHHGFHVKYITTFDVERLYKEKEKYLYEYLGAEAAQDQIVNSNMSAVYEDAKTFAGELSDVVRDVRVPTCDDIKQLLSDGYYLIPYVNQKILQSNDGYAAHMIVLYGYSDRGVRIHNPGPPPTRASEIAWDLFVRAWSSPSEAARILMAVKPNLS